MGTRTLKRVGDYELTGRLGSGGMSRVYRAVKAGDHTEVALKLTPVENDVDVDIADFHREVLVGRRLQHPRCVTASAHGIDNGYLFIVMPIINGVPLSQTTRLRDPNRRPSSRRSSAWKCQWAADRLEKQWGNIAQLAVHACEALEACHSAGVIHRDIKPGNLLMDKSGETWLIDFGLAWMHRGPQGHELVTHAGTNRYLPPEVFDKQRDERSDIYSLGLTLQELTTGRKPWGDISHEEIGECRADLKVEPTLSVRNDVPQVLADWIDRAAADDPRERHQTAGELLEHARLVREQLVPTKTVCVEETTLRTLVWQSSPPASSLTEDVWFS